MSTSTSIEWTDTTWNPTRGCSRVSPGCTNCYAERQARRFAGKNGAYEGLIHSTGSWNGGITLVEGALDEPYRWRKPRRVFVDSMSDLFHERVPFEFIDKVFETMINTPHTYQVLTKRPARMREYMMDARRPRRVREGELPANIWLGVSVEDQERADERIPILLSTPAAVRFLSCEPLLGEINLRLETNAPLWAGDGPGAKCRASDRLGLHWVIIGGESGNKARPTIIGDIRILKEQCEAANVPVFVKQLGTHPMNWLGVRFDISDRKGKIMDEWPADLRIRQFPRAAA